MQCDSEACLRMMKSFSFSTEHRQRVGKRQDIFVLTGTHRTPNRRVGGGHMWMLAAVAMSRHNVPLRYVMHLFRPTDWLASPKYCLPYRLVSMALIAQRRIRGKGGNGSLSLNRDLSFGPFMRV